MHIHYKMLLCFSFGAKLMYGKIHTKISLASLFLNVLLTTSCIEINGEDELNFWNVRHLCSIFPLLGFYSNVTVGSVWIRAEDAYRNLVDEIYTLYDHKVWFLAGKEFLLIANYCSFRIKKIYFYLFCDRQKLKENISW